MERNREIPTMHLRDNFYGDKSRFVEQHVSNSAIGDLSVFLGMTRAKLGFQPLDSGFIVGNMTVTDGAGNTKTLGLRYQDRMSVGGFE